MKKKNNKINNFSASTINLFVRDKPKYLVKDKDQFFYGKSFTIRGQNIENKLCSIPFYKK